MSSFYPYRFILILSFIFSLSALGQSQTDTSIDSLKTLVSQAQEKDKLSYLKELNEILIQSSQFKQAYPYLEEMLKLSRKESDYQLISKSYRYLSDYFQKQGDKDKTIHFAEQSLMLNDSLNNLQEFINDINRLGIAYHYFQQYEDAINTFKKGLQKYQEIGQEVPLSTIPQLFFNLAVSLGKVNDIEAKTQFLIKGIETADKMNLFKQKSHALYSLGYTYMELGHYQKAEKYFLESLGAADSLDLPDFYKNCNYHALGINYSRWGKYSQAILYNRKALKEFQSNGNRLYEFDVLNNMAITYRRKHSIDTAIVYAQDALKVANKLKHQMAINGALLTLSDLHILKENFNIAESYLKKVAKDTANVEVMPIESLSDYYAKTFLINEKKHQYRKALWALKKYKTLSDSINKLKSETQFVEIENKYQTAVKEKENLRLRREKEKQSSLLQKENWQKKVSLTILIMTLLILGLLIYSNVKSAKKNKIIKNLQQELHHRIKNNLSIINRFINVIKEEFENEPLFTEKLRDLQNRINSINEVHTMLYKQENINELSLKSYINQLSENVKESFPDNQIVIHNNIPESYTLDSNQFFPLGITINEFLTNTFKYAFDDKKGYVFITMKLEKNKYYFKISDNGKGLPADFDFLKDANFGLRISRLLVMQMGGNVELINKDGVHLHIEFPKK